MDKKLFSYLCEKDRTMTNISKPDNPFFTVIDIPDDYFCDRDRETDEIIGLIENGNNVVLKSQRRIGKSSLIHHIFNRKSVKSRYNTLYVDIFGTKNMDDFHVAFQNKLLGAPFAKGAKIKAQFETLARGIRVSLGEYNPVTGAYSLPSLGTSPSQMPRIPMEELFDFLEKTKRPNLIVFDEFQQIQYYPERMAAILRSFTQKMNNTRFIFSGSSNHLLSVMFQMASQPFYKSAEPFDIKAIPLHTYSQFCVKMFSGYGKAVNPGAVSFLYHLFSGETAPMQETMNMVFRNVKAGHTADVDDVKDAVEKLLDIRDSTFREVLNRIDREHTRNTLFCIAAMGVAESMTSSKTMRYYRLDNASSVQKSLLNLMDEKSPVIRNIRKGVYVIDDRLFELWIAREGSYLDIKFASAESRFIRQMELENPQFHPTAPKPSDNWNG